MSEETGSKPIELSDEEMKNAAGGAIPGQSGPPSGWVACKVVIARHDEYLWCYGFQNTGGKCVCSACSCYRSKDVKYHGWLCTDAEIQEAYNNWSKSK